VSYNGLPLYFFQGDSAPGDANGVYTNWEAVKP
jgi:predicted lipoprotein with Yx(FWY)xxD motif